MSAALQYFEENLPHRPYHTDDLAFGLRISGKGRALLARYIQQNQPHAQFWLVFDVDRGGFIVEEEHFGLSYDVETPVPYDFHSAGELLKMCDYNGLSISGLMMHNELALRSKAEIDAG